MRLSYLLTFLWALWISAPFTVSLAHAKPPSELRGIWLIAPKPHDLFIEAGVISAEYPLLVIDEDGGFRAYRFGISCASELTRITSEVDKIEPCIRYSRISNLDRLTGLAIPIADGRVTHSEMGWWLRQNDTRPLFEAIRISSPSDRRVDGIPYQFALFVHLFGEPLSASITDNQMILGSVRQSFAYGFVRVDIGQLAGVGSLLNVIGLSYGQYFRCAMKNVHDMALLSHAEGVQNAYNRKDQHYFEQLQLRHSSPEDIRRAQSLRKEASDLTVAFLDRLGPEVRLQQRFGEFLGCTDR